MRTLILASLFFVCNIANAGWEINNEQYHEIRKLKELRKMVCNDIMPIVFQRFDNTNYKEVCSETDELFGIK